MRIQALSFFLLLSIACGGGGTSSPQPTSAPTPPPTPAAPAIQAFTATPSAIAPGGSATLSWSVSPATALSLSGDSIPGKSISVTGTSYGVTPTATTTYTLTAGTSKATVTVTVGSQAPKYGNFSGADLGVSANLNGALAFTAANAWNQDISNAAVDPNSTNILASIGLSQGLHPDFGSGLWQGAPIGIPYLIVDSSQTKVAITTIDYTDESDPGPFPIPITTPIEGQKADGSAFSGDRHVLVIDRDANRLYELGNAYPQASTWQASGSYLFTLDGAVARPTAKPGWTSADAAGLPIFPGLARYEEASSGTIFHALRFTVNASRKAYVPPATHWAASSTDPNLPPMGMRVRLKASFVIPTTFSTESKAILQALKTYGMIVADNGSNWFISGAPDARWNNSALLSELGSVKGSDFEVIRMDGIVTP